MARDASKRRRSRVGTVSQRLPSAVEPDRPRHRRPRATIAPWNRARSVLPERSVVWSDEEIEEFEGSDTGDGDWYAIRTDPWPCPACGAEFEYVDRRALRDRGARSATTCWRSRRSCQQVGRNPKIVLYDDVLPTMTLFQWHAQGRPVHGIKASSRTFDRPRRGRPQLRRYLPAAGGDGRRRRGWLAVGRRVVSSAARRRRAAHRIDEMIVPGSPLAGIALGGHAQDVEDGSARARRARTWSASCQVDYGGDGRVTAISTASPRLRTPAASAWARRSPTCKAFPAPSARPRRARARSTAGATTRFDLAAGAVALVSVRWATPRSRALALLALRPARRPRHVAGDEEAKVVQAADRAGEEQAAPSAVSSSRPPGR